MTKEVRIELLPNGVHWARNILVELAGNHMQAVSSEARSHLRSAIASLNEFTDQVLEDVRNS